MNVFKSVIFFAVIGFEWLSTIQEVILMQKMHTWTYLMHFKVIVNRKMLILGVKISSCCSA